MFRGDEKGLVTEFREKMLMAKDEEVHVSVITRSGPFSSDFRALSGAKSAHVEASSSPLWRQREKLCLAKKLCPTKNQVRAGPS